MLRWDGLAPFAYLAGMNAPTLPLILTGVGPGTITGTYTAYLRFVDDRGNFSNLSPISLPITVSNVGSIVYLNVQPAPGDPKIVRRQILRNTSGQAATYYVEIDTTDLNSVTFTGTMTDAVLATQPSQSILDVQGNILANRHNPPPSHKTALAHHLGRMFAAVEFIYSQGAAKVAFGSNQVAGVGTEWTTAMVGRFLYVQGAVNSYQIAAVDPINQVLTLAGFYLDATDNFAVYAIRPAPAERKLVYYSEAGQPESWPPINALTVQDDGDEITGLMTKGSFIYILEKRHIYRFTFQSDPATDGYLFLSSLRGCLNNRCWVVVEDVAYMLDEQGIHAFGGGADDEPISTVIQDIFRQGPAFDSPYRINWKARDLFHCVHFPQQETIRWFVCLSGHYMPRHAVALNYRQKRWWIEEYAIPIGASALGLLGGQPQVFLGADSRRVLALWQGTLDGPDPAKGTVRGTVSSATLDTFTDGLASFPSVGVVGNPVSIVAGTGAGQQRIVRSISGKTVKLTQPWLTLPDTTSVYQLGGIQWRYETGWFRFLLSEEFIERRIAVVFQPTPSQATMTLRLFFDFSPTPVAWKQNLSLAEGNGVSVQDGSGDLLVDLTKPSGYIQKRFPGHREFYIDGPRYVTVQLSGVTGADPQKVYLISLDAAGQASAR